MIFQIYKNLHLDLKVPCFMSCDLCGDDLHVGKNFRVVNIYDFPMGGENFYGLEFEIVFLKSV